MVLRVGSHARFALALVLAGGLIGSALTLGSGWLWPRAAAADAGGPFHTARVVLLILGLLAAAGAVCLIRDSELRADRLIASARRWGQGELAHRLAPRRHEPLAEVGTALDSMAASLQLREETTRRRAEEQILQAEKFATTGRLAAGVAHEINNPLGGILLCTDLLLESTPVNDPRREQMTRIVTQAARAKEIVRGLLDFARQSPPRVERVDLNRVVLEALALLDRQPLYQRVRVRPELTPVPLWVQADVVKMQQVFVNIIMNALEAMREGGTLTVRSGYSEREGFCRVAITDTGFGIPAENLPRLFEPFFTTKEVGQGIGLGLAISHGIVQQHQGDIEVQSTVGSGTTFRILLPLAKEA